MSVALTGRMTMDPIAIFIARLHNLLGHDKAAAVLGGPVGDKRACVLCWYERNPTIERQRVVVSRIGTPVLLTRQLVALKRFSSVPCRVWGRVTKGSRACDDEGALRWPWSGAAPHRWLHDRGPYPVPAPVIWSHQPII
jgi:hypothetical protein